MMDNPSAFRGLAAAVAMLALGVGASAREFEIFGSSYRRAQQRTFDSDAEYMAAQAKRKSQDKTHGIKSKGRRGARVRSRAMMLALGQVA